MNPTGGANRTALNYAASTGIQTLSCSLHLSEEPTFADPLAEWCAKGIREDSPYPDSTVTAQLLSFFIHY